MANRAHIDSDPLRWTLAFSLLFAALSSIRLTIPTTPYFDEVHYLPAARALLEQSEWLNREHPMLGKQFIAFGIALFGDTPLGWRVFAWLAGILALFSAMRAIWFASLSRFATIAYGILLGTGFALFIHARIAMLDIFMVAFMMVALWQCAAAMREPETGVWRLAVAGAALGLSMGSKWNVVPVAMLPGLAFLAARVAAGRRRLVASHRGIPVPGVSLFQAALLLGALPLIVYWLTYLPAMLVERDPHRFGEFVALHSTMIAMQSSVIEHHPYQSNWPDWLLNLRAIWYLYEPVDGAQRGVMLIGNPLTMLLGLAAAGWAAWAGIARRRWDALAVAVLFAVSLGMWIVVNKPIQFYYHYFLPSCFLLAALALALGEFWRRGARWLPLAVLGGSVAMFAWFYPVLSAAPLDGPAAFETWMWLDSWR